jgi:excisionase family DNA binding protein
LGKACRTKIEREIWIDKVQQTLYTIKTLCQYLSISRATIYRIIQRGELEPLRIGSAVRFTEIEVNRYLARQQKQARTNEVGF